VLWWQKGMITKTTVRFVLCALFLSLVLAGCSSTVGCTEKTVFERVPVVVTDTVNDSEIYTYRQPSVEEQCDYRFNAKISYEKSFWDGDTLRRIAYIRNLENETGLFTITKVYLKDNKELDRDYPPSQFVIDGKQTRTLYIIWNTAQDIGKEVELELLDTSQRKNPQCEKVVVYKNMTGSKTTTDLVNRTVYETRFKKVCI